MKIALLIAYLLVLAAGHALRTLNLNHLKRHGAEVPEGFEGAIDPCQLRRTSAYTLECSRLGQFEPLLDSALLLLFLFGGLLPVYDRWIAGATGSFVLQGVLFFFGLQLAKGVCDIPFSLYRNFCIEARYGFNTMSLRLWLSDLGKGLALGMVLGGALLGGAFWLVSASPEGWWLWVWGFFALFTLLLMYVSPYLIEPLFFKFEPVREQGLEERIRSLMERAGLRVSRVFQVDASRRSRHSNAYFTGIGRVKRIVLFDTLLEQMSQDEVLAVLAHEVGHWKKRHILKRLLVTELLALGGLYLAWRLVEWGGLPGLLGLEQASFAAQLVILSFLGSIAGFPFTPLSSWLSRRDEWQADRFARELTGEPEALASGLVKLSRENLANLHPHPLYAAVFYSHPPVVERVRRLRQP
ncbi:peptidase M48 [Desulfuromonas versatilis]|uniref:Peptidase M48 n=1 Tax=Desulfuromonas versatilis TaxID=2802975 RepID=A0ABM8HQ05_9BACT|nr:M48 family metallopeptidase [Desulfuromonas versatilis]BCR03819.1 peptidase M48 [Desulfuromonas versatilis]